jgi:hypothetical protein
MMAVIVGGLQFWIEGFFVLRGPSVSVASGGICARRMPAGTPALLCGRFAAAEREFGFEFRGVGGTIERRVFFC